MIGNERVNPEAKFMELFSRIGQIEAGMIDILERLEEIHAVLNVNPEPNNRKTLSLKSGTR